MRTYHRVKADTAERRTFTITVGTVPGYTGALPLQHAEGIVLTALQTWQAERIGRAAPYLTAILSTGTLAYGWLAGPPAGVILRDEPVVIVHGNVSVLYAAHVSDAGVCDMLNALAARLGAALDQERVYVTYLDSEWVLEADNAVLPQRQ